MIIEGEGIIIAMRKFGESSCIATCFLREHGLQSGMARLGRTNKKHGTGLSPGNMVYARWQARLAEHLGQYTLEVQKNITSQAHQNRIALYTLNTVLAWLNHVLPFSDPAPALYDCTLQLLDIIGRDGEVTEIMQGYTIFELNLLQYLGHPLDLSSCVVTGKTEDLTFVSPKSGRAVSTDAGAAYKDKLLALPHFLKEKVAHLPTMQDINAGLQLTYFFLERYLLEHYGKRPPSNRSILMSSLS